MNIDTNENATCSRCGNLATPCKHGIGTGYGIQQDGSKVCYACCGDLDRESMIKTGKATLYLQIDKDDRLKTCVTNWPNSLKFLLLTQGNIRESRHNIGRVKRSFWFIGPDRHVWYGYQIGDYNQIAHCKRTKEVWIMLGYRGYGCAKLPKASPCTFPQWLAERGNSKETIKAIMQAYL